MGNENKAEASDRSKHREACRAREFISCIVSGVKSEFVIFESFDECLPIFYDVLTFMAIHVHSVLMFPIPPPHLSEPAACSTF